MLSSAQQIQRLTFPPFVNDNTGENLQDAEYLQDMRDIYAETDPDVTGPDGSRRSSDLYSPELNLEAHRTAQEVLIHLLVLHNINNNDIFLYSYFQCYINIFVTCRYTIVYKIHHRLLCWLKKTITSLILIYQIQVSLERRRYVLHFISLSYD